MKCEFQSVQELMEYVEMEAQRRVKKILEKNEMKVLKFELKSGALAEFSKASLRVGGGFRG